MFSKHTRSIERAESLITEVAAYRQRSCFVVADYRLAPEHRAVDSAHPGLLRFGRVLHWVRQSRMGGQCEQLSSCSIISPARLLTDCVVPFRMG